MSVINLVYYFFRKPCPHSSNGFQKFWLYYFFLILCLVFPNWKSHVGLLTNQHGSSNSINNFYLTNFLAFHFLLRCLTFEILYLFYRYIGTPMIWIIVLILSIYPYFSTSFFGWLCILFFLFFIVKIMCQVPVDTTINPHNPYLKEFYEALRTDYFKPFYSLLPFQQLCFIYICIPLFILLQNILFLFFYIWFTVTFMEHPDLNVPITILWLFIINLYVFIILFFFVRHLFYILKFIITFLLGLVNFINRLFPSLFIKLETVLFHKFSFFFDSKKKNGDTFNNRGFTFRLLINLFEMYLENRYYNADTTAFLIASNQSVNPFDVEQAMVYVDTLMYEDELLDNTIYPTPSISNFQYVLDDSELTYMDIWIDTTDRDPTSYKLDLEMFFKHKLDDSSVYTRNNTSTIDTEINPVINFFELFNIPFYSRFRKFFYPDPPLLTDPLDNEDTFDFPSFSDDSQAGDLRLHLVEELLEVSSEFKLGATLDNRYFSSEYLTILNDWHDINEEGENPVFDNSYFPSYELENFIASIHLDYSLFFKNLIRQLSFESQKQFCFYYDPVSKRGYSVYIHPDRVRNFLIRSELLYNQYMANKYRHFFFKRYLDKINQTGLGRYVQDSFFSTNESSVGASRTRNWENLVQDFPNLPNFRLFRSADDWKMYCKDMQEKNIIVNYQDLFERLFMRFISSDPSNISDWELNHAVPNILTVIKKLESADSAIPPRKNVYFTKNNLDSEKSFYPSSFFFDTNLGQKKFYIFEHSKYKFLDLSGDDSEINSYFFFQAGFNVAFTFPPMFPIYRCKNDMDSTECYFKLQGLLGLNVTNRFEFFELFRNLRLSSQPSVFAAQVVRISNCQLFRTSFNFFYKKIKVRHGLGRYLGNSFLTQIRDQNTLISANLKPLRHILYISNFSERISIDYTSLKHLISSIQKPSKSNSQVFIELIEASRLSCYYKFNSVGVELARAFVRDQYESNLKDKNDGAARTPSSSVDFYYERDYLSTFFSPYDDFDYIELLRNSDWKSPSGVIFQRFLKLGAASRACPNLPDNLVRANLTRSLLDRDHNLEKKFPQGEVFSDYCDDLFYEFHWTHSAEWCMPSLDWEPPAKWRPPANWRPPVGWKGPSIYWIPPKFWELPVWWKRKWGLPISWVSPKVQRIRLKRQRAYLDKLKP